MDIETLEKPLPVVTELLKLTFYVSTTMGFLITLIYCAGIGYYPTGITIGDTIFFISATLGFSFLYLVVTYALHCAGVLISPILRITQNLALRSRAHFKKNTRKEAPAGEIINQHTAENINPPIDFRKLRLDDTQAVLIGIVVLIYLVSLYFKNIDKALGLTLTIIAMGFFFGLWNTKTKMELQSPTKTSQKRAFIVILSLIVPLLFSQSNKDIIIQSMTMIGVRHENATISLSERYKQFLQDNGIDAEHGIYGDVDILFRGIGNNVVLKVETLTISVPSEDVIVGIHDSKKSL